MSSFGHGSSDMFRSWDVNDVPSEDVMREIIQDALIIREWKHVARKLGISEADIEDIDYKESGLKDKCYEMLSTWRKSNGLSGTMGLLMMMLREINHNTIPDKFGAPPLADKSQISYHKIMSNKQLISDIKDLEDEFSNKADVYVGRKEQIDKVESSWKSVSIFGIYGLAGIGKSRFVRHVTRDLKEQFDASHDRSQFVQYTIDLRGVNSADDLKVKFTTSVGMRASPRSYVQDMTDLIKKSGNLFVFVYENVEYIEENRPLRSQFLNDCRELALVSARVRIFINSRVKYAILEPPFLPIELKSLSKEESKELLKITAPNFDFGEELEKIVDLCGGHPMALKIVAKRIEFEELLTMSEVVADLEQDRLEALDGEEYSDEERIALMINRTLCHLSDDQKYKLAQLAFIQNSFSMQATVDVLGLDSIMVAKKKVLHDLHRRHLVEVVTKEDSSIRISIHALVRDWVNKNVKINDSEVRVRFVQHYGNLFKDFGTRLKSKDGAVPAMVDFGLELPNLKKLISESKHCDEEMFTNTFKDIIYKHGYIVEKYMTDQAVTFFENIYNGVKAFANATDKGVIMTNIASALSEIKDEYMLALDWFNKAEAELREGGPSTDLAVLHRKKAWNFYMMDQLHDAIECAMKTHDMFVELGQEKTIPFMVTVAILGIVHTDIGNLDEGEKYNLQSISLCNELVGRQYSLGGYFNNMGITYRLKGDLEKAQSYIEKSLEIKKDFIFGPDRSVVLSLISLAYIHLIFHDDTAQALELLKEANLQIKRLPFSANLHGFINDEFFKVHLKRGDHSEALKMAEAAVVIYREHRKDARYTTLIESYTQYGEVLYKLGRFKESITALLEAYNMKDIVYKQMPKRLFLHKTLVLLIRAHIALEQPSEAFKYYEEACQKMQEVTEMYESENKMKLKDSTLADLQAFQSEFTSLLH